MEQETKTFMEWWKEIYADMGRNGVLWNCIPEKVKLNMRRITSQEFGEILVENINRYNERRGRPYEQWKLTSEGKIEMKDPEKVWIEKLWEKAMEVNQEAERRGEDWRIIPDIEKGVMKVNVKEYEEWKKDRGDIIELIWLFDAK
jgi:hypothetical protein